MIKIILSTILLFLFINVSIAATYDLLPDKSSSFDDVKIITIDDSSFNVQFNISKLETADAGLLSPYAINFKKLSFNQLNVKTNSGLPALPFYSVLVKGRADDVKIDYRLGIKRRVLNIVPMPAQKEKLRCVDCQVPPFIINWESFESSVENFYEVEFMGDFRGVPVSRVSFYPANYSYDQKVLEIYPQIEFSVSSRGHYESLDDLIADTELNEKYIIVTPEKFVDSLSEFIDYKESLGFEIIVYKLEEIGESYEEIKTFIHNEYELMNDKFTYALLVGHEHNFPTEYVPTSSSYRTPSDLGYFTYGGEDDFIPDVFYGRLIVDSEEDVKNQVSKIIAYETNMIDNQTGWSRHVGMASSEGYNPSDEQYLEQMTSPFIEGYGIESSIFLQKNSNSTPENVNKVLSSGAAWLNYIGHGSGSSWASMSRTYRSSHIKELSSEAVKPVIIDVACQNGSLLYGRGKLGERFMNATTPDGKPIGAVAYYGGSVNISWHPPAIMAVGINKLKQENEIFALGKSLLAGQLYLLQNYSSLSSVKDNFRWYHLFGDPSLRIHLGN